MQLPERWQAGLAGIVSIAAIGMLALLRPESTLQEAQRTAWQQQQALRAARWQSVMSRQRALLPIEEKTVAAGKPFSPVDFQRQGSELVSWTPAGRGGELALEIEWNQIPSVFALLAERDMQVMAFSIKAGVVRHMLTLQLEGHDGD
ncbi:HofO family protein [Pseudocitrobacter cyperus]|uniref:DNA utilization protein HofO C-terminal domain-containing protein n=1 Tax=Pseudocitrobacter cyperus TaxID=3112843 RepID=A0ABV0HPP2_9ENTR